jgi:hypothetical protein
MASVRELTVGFGRNDLQELWQAPAGSERASLLSALDGSEPLLQSAVTLYRDERNLYVLFETSDDEVLATKIERDSSLYEEDVLEVFLAPERLERYFEFEVNPLGTLFDAVVDSPMRERGSMQVDRAWNCEGFWAAIRCDRRDPAMASLRTLLCIPFAGLGVIPPRPGDTWRANFYRIDRSSRGDAFSAWSPTLRTPADFHVPDRFGLIRFV